MMDLMATTAASPAHTLPPAYVDAEPSKPPEYNRANSAIIQNVHTAEDEEEIDIEVFSPIVEVGSTVIANLVVTPKEDIQVDDILIAFTLITSYSKHQVAALTRQNTKRAVSVHHIVPTDLPDDRRLQKGCRYIFPFSLFIPEKLPPEISDCDYCDMHRRLPPSLGALYDHPVQVYDPLDLPGAVARITYGLRAVITKERKITRDYFNPVRHFEPQYPLDSELYDSKKCSVTKCIGGGSSSSSTSFFPLWRRSGAPDKTTGNVSMTALGPVMINKHRHPDKINLELYIQSSSLVTPKIRNVSYLLQSTTEVSGNRPITLTIAKNTFEVGNIQWSQIDDTSQSTTIPTPISIDTKDPAFIPSFAACVVSRTYQIVAKLGTDHGTLTLSVPLRVINDRTIPNE